MRLISEQLAEGNTLQVICEGEGPQKRTYLQGIFAQANLKNRNGRIYPKDILEAASNEYIEKYVNMKRALGELDHPQGPNINTDRSCILVESLWWEGDNLYGKAKVLSAPMGRLLECLINDGVQMGVSTRGLGGTKRGKWLDEVADIVNSYSMRAIDVVPNPSGINCFVNGIMESVEYILDAEGNVIPKNSEQKEETIEESHEDTRIIHDVPKIIADLKSLFHK